MKKQNLETFFWKKNKWDNETAKDQNDVYNLHSSEKLSKLHRPHWYTVHWLYIIPRQILSYGWQQAQVLFSPIF